MWNGSSGRGAVREGEPATVRRPVEVEDLRREAVGQLALLAAERRHEPDLAPLRGEPHERDVASVGRPRRVLVRPRIVGEAKRWAGSRHLDVDVPVVLGGALPRERDPVAAPARCDRRPDLQTGRAGERHDPRADRGLPLPLAQAQNESGEQGEGGDTGDREGRAATGRLRVRGRSGGPVRPRRRDLLHRRHEPVAHLGHGLDVVAARGAFAQHTPELRHGAVERVLGDDRVGPDTLQELLAGDRPPGAVGEAEQELHHPGLDPDLPAAANEEVAERVDPPLSDPERRACPVGGRPRPVLEHVRPGLRSRLAHGPRIRRAPFPPRGARHPISPICGISTRRAPRGGLGRRVRQETVSFPPRLASVSRSMVLGMTTFRDRLFGFLTPEPRQVRGATPGSSSRASGSGSRWH